VKNTVLIYQAAFTNPSGISACVKWANVHLETFNTLLVRQLSAIEKQGKLWRECMDVVWGHEKEMLGDFGLDFREVIGRGLEVRDISSRNDKPGAGGNTASTGNRQPSRSKSRPRGAT